MSAVTATTARPDRVEITEVGMRDGFQLEPSHIPTETKIEVGRGLIAAGIRRLEATAFVSPRAVPQMADVCRGHATLTGAVATAFGCPFEGDIDPDQVSRVVEGYAKAGIRRVTLGDTTGMATPPIVERLCRALTDRFPEALLSLHFHNTRGLGLVNVATALEMGLTRYESSVGGLGGCPFAPGATGNVCTEDLVNYLDEMGIASGVSLAGVSAVARRLEEVLDRRLPGQVMRAGPRLTLSQMSAVATATG